MKETPETQTKGGKKLSKEQAKGRVKKQPKDQVDKRVLKDLIRMNQRITNENNCWTEKEE